MAPAESNRIPSAPTRASMLGFRRRLRLKPIVRDEEPGSTPGGSTRSDSLADQT